jgi:transcriptional regulator with XRE-family HTH domain
VYYLEHVRRSWKWTQRDLARAVGVPQYHISDFETGKVWPTPDQLRRLGEVLRLSPHQVMEEVPVPTAPEAA